MNVRTLLSRLVRPLSSRKVRVALATVASGFLADWGFSITEDKIFMILGVGVAIILGIAIEDAGAKK
jgi:hypothetical protein